MCQSKIQLVVLAIVVFLFLSLTILFSQEWSNEQKEALAVLEKLYDAWAKRDLDGYMDCLHENYIGWYHNNPLPT